jgi:serine-type D-Ala-D-Ala carboxypeptidase (penicillin-binding protein 5/6)
MQAMSRYFSCLCILLLLFSSAASAAEPTAPQVAAKSWLLADYHSGRVLAEHKADERHEPASLTKLMTAYVLFKQLRAGKFSLDDKLPVSAKAWSMPGARTYVRLNDRVRAEDLIKGMVVQSGNDATMALVEYVAGSEDQFVVLMNAEAAALGMQATHFANATGLLQAEHYSSARDINRLGVALLREFPEYYQRWYGLKEFNYAGITQRNRNTLLWRLAGADGVKTGHTRSAGFCLVASAKRDNMRLMATLLGAADEKARAEAGMSLLEFGFGAYETRLLYQSLAPSVHVRVWMGDIEMLPAGIGRDLYLTLPRGDFGKLKANIVITHTPTAPINSGDTIGQVRLTLDQEPLGDYPLLALRNVQQGTLVQRLLDQIQLWLH